MAIEKNQVKILAFLFIMAIVVAADAIYLRSYFQPQVQYSPGIVESQVKKSAGYLIGFLVISILVIGAMVEMILRTFAQESKSIKQLGNLFEKY